MSKSKKPKTRVAIILDRSGSMASIRTQAVTNYNEQVQQMKENAKDQDIFAHLVTFNGSVTEHLWGVKADELEEAAEESYACCGSTAFRDAVGYTISKLQEEKVDDDTAFLIVIISDGEENASSHYSASSLKEMIESAQATGKWTFSFMGCSENYVKKVAKETSIPLGNCAVWSNENAAIAASSLTKGTERRSLYYSSRNSGITSSDCLYSDNKSQLADFTDMGDDVATPAIMPDMPMPQPYIDPYDPNVQVQNAKPDWSYIPSRTGDAGWLDQNQFKVTCDSGKDVLGPVKKTYREDISMRSRSVFSAGKAVHFS